MENNKQTELKLPWIPCSVRMPTEDGEYTITFQREGDDEPSVDESERFEDGKWQWYKKEEVLAWCPKIQPYEPPIEKPTTPPPPSDSLMGWLPLGKERIPLNKLVRFLYLINDIVVSFVGFQDGCDGTYYVYFNIRYPSEISSRDIVAWKYFDNDELPSLDQFRGIEKIIKEGK